MAELKDASETSDIPSSSSSSYLEVTCKSSGIVRRFAPGTKAGFATSLINAKLDVGTPLALYIQASKFGEEPIIFGPSSVLINYGSGWNLHTVLDSQQGSNKRKGAQVFNTEIKTQVTEPAINLLYIGKIVLAFLFIFLLGGIFTLALEYLPQLMLLINTSL